MLAPDIRLSECKHFLQTDTGRGIDDLCCFGMAAFQLTDNRTERGREFSAHIAILTSRDPLVAATGTSHNTRRDDFDAWRRDGATI